MGRTLKFYTACLASAALPAILSSHFATAGVGAPSRARLVVSECSPTGIAEAELRAVLSMELGAGNVVLVPAGGSASDAQVVLEVRTSCESREEVVLRATWGGEGRQRSLDLMDIPEHSRVRVLALSLAELLDALARPLAAPSAVPANDGGVVLYETTPDSDAGIVLYETAPDVGETAAAGDAAPKPKLTAAPPLPRDASEAGTAERATRAGPVVDRAPLPALPHEQRGEPNRVGLALESRWFIGGQRVWGGRLLVDAKALTVGASVLGGSSDVAAGMLNATLLHGFLAFSPLRVRSDAAWLLAAGPRAGLGVLNVEATPAETVTGSSAIEAYFDAAAFALVERQLAGDFALRATFEVGYARGMVALADGEAAGRYAGVFAGGHVALCFAP